MPPSWSRRATRRRGPRRCWGWPLPAPSWPGRAGSPARSPAGGAGLGLEPDRASWELARQRLRAVGRGEVRNIASGDLGTERFDLVCAFEVLEHLEDDAAAVKQWAALLRARGWLLLSTPALQRRFGP